MQKSVIKNIFGKKMPYYANNRDLQGLLNLNVQHQIIFKNIAEPQEIPKLNQKHMA